MKSLLVGVCLAALTTSAFAADPVQETEAPPVPASDSSIYTPEHGYSKISGYAEVYTGNSWFTDIPQAPGTQWVLGGAGRINVPFAERWNIQGDLVADRTELYNNAHLSAIGGVAHLNWRNDDFAVGGFGEAKKLIISTNTSKDMWAWKVGPEAQVYFGNLTLYGQGYYGRADFGLRVSRFDEMGVRGVARYFVQDNLRFEVEASFHRTKDVCRLASDFDIFALAAQVDYRFDDTPWSVFGRYQRDAFSLTNVANGPTLHMDKFSVGLRASFGSKTLLEEDRKGATMDTYRSNIVSLYSN